MNFGFFHRETHHATNGDPFKELWICAIDSVLAYQDSPQWYAHHSPDLMVIVKLDSSCQSDVPTCPLRSLPHPKQECICPSNACLNTELAVQGLTGFTVD